MRPLPILDDLAPSQPVFDPAQDDLQNLIGADLSNFDTLQSLLDSTTDPAVSALPDMGSTLDTIGAIFDGIDGTFAHLDDSLSQLNYEQEILDTLALEKSFADGLGSWAPDLAGALPGFLADIGSALDAIFRDILGAVGAVVGDVVQGIKDLFVWIVGGIQTAIDLANVALQTAIDALITASFNGSSQGPPIQFGTGF